MNYTLLAARILFAAIFIIGAPNHFDHDTIQGAADHGIPLASLLVPLSGLLALAGGLSVMLGFKGRVGAWLLITFLVPVTLMMHNFWSVTDPMAAQFQEMMFLKNLTMVAGALYIAQFGTGEYSLDNRTQKHPFEAQKSSAPAVAHT